ncbi:MAG: hypothetical protein LCH54_10065 [Bacteroidetes bacterium]|nr:hypothetical protein [Bacteroidota bacterium]
MRVLPRKIITFLTLSILSSFGFNTGFSQPETNPHGKLTIDCQSCHIAESWTVLKSPMIFDHSTDTKYPLTGTHKSVSCMSCHRSLNFSVVKSDCKSCHEDVHRGTLGQDCEQCHETMVWGPMTPGKILSIHQKGRFPLTGAHPAANCTDCHPKSSQGMMFKVNHGLDCISCHQNDFNTASNPDHKALGFPTDCQQCHNSFSWTPASFDHNKFNFALTGAHSLASCGSCHTGNRYKGTPTDCYSCHQKEFIATVNPKHDAAGFSTDCQTCHSTIAWQPGTYDHNKTRFPLTGGHAAVPSCNSCHVGDKFAGLSMECSSCHMKDFNATTNPDHKVLGYPLDCQSCHSPFAWTPSSFNHSLYSFALTGAHSITDCNSCHVNNVFKGTPKDCFSCHKDVYQTAQNPNHVSGKLSTDCQTCHTTITWRPSTFNHSATRFPLTGAHSLPLCESCHVNGQFAGTAFDCYSCHQNDYNATTNPKHTPADFPFNCQVCHSDVAWKPAVFDHNKTAFPLTGQHITATCASCHTGGVYAGTPKECVSCHLKDSQAALNPKHTSAAFSNECSTCHTTVAWKPAQFNHSLTKFPLTGAHTAQSCESCHTGGNYTTIPAADCYSCHQADYTGTSNPKHTPAAFPFTCETCHSTTTWAPATFDHSKTKFPLTGKHAVTECNACHTGGVFTGLQTTCVPCHQADYNNTKNPKHTLPAFAMTCETCHTTTGWTPAAFDHNKTAFPLTGGHVSVDCASCHINGQYTGLATDCKSCHTPDFNKAANHLSQGYPTTCLTCHTTATWKPSTYNNHNGWFPIYSGKHKPSVWLNKCATCHTVATNFKVFVCTDCHEHNKSSMDSEHRNISGYVWNSANCYSCHPDGNDAIF